MQCGECKGTGRLTLFTSVKPCRACGGSGYVKRDDSDLVEIVRDIIEQAPGVPGISVFNGPGIVTPNGGFTFNP